MSTDAASGHVQMFNTLLGATGSHATQKHAISGRCSIDWFGVFKARASRGSAHEPDQFRTLSIFPRHYPPLASMYEGEVA